MEQGLTPSGVSIGVTPGEWNNSDVEFETLVNQHKDAVYRQMLRVCGNQEDAEDVLIDAMLRAWQHIDQLEDANAFRSWLAQIARRVCWHLKDREAMMPLLQLSAMPAGGDEIPSADVAMETRIDAARMKASLRRAVDGLPAQFREVYRMRDLDDVPGEETARRLGVTLALMKSRLHRARAMIRAALDDELMRGQKRA